MEFVLVTGLSGGGKSQAASILEDLGYYCVDNLPAELIPRFVDLCMAAEEKYDRVALVSDIRGMDGSGKLREAIQDAQERAPLRILFLEAGTEAILKRYKETRHRHPLDPEGKDLRGAVTLERERMAWLKDLADVVVDTTDYPLAKLRQRLVEEFSRDSARSGMDLHVRSFGYKYGIPEDADLVLDVRFLPNPFYVPELKELTGLESPVRDYVLSYAVTGTFLDKVMDMLRFLIPCYEEEGKPSLMVCVGCTGGKHRSVVLAERITGLLHDCGYRADCAHRDLK
ncbi:MAG: RNase adapter RapZ [Oscillospiraceae bacterium]|nr:RNase adapter RapZ [Oscillospiraceae bacterium]